MWNSDILNKLNQKVNASIMGGGEKRIEKQHASGKLTARERLEILFDKGTFVEVGGLIESRITDFGIADKKVPGDGVVVGLGRGCGSGSAASVRSDSYGAFGGYFVIGSAIDGCVNGCCAGRNTGDRGADFACGINRCNSGIRGSPNRIFCICCIDWTGCNRNYSGLIAL